MSKDSQTAQQFKKLLGDRQKQDVEAQISEAAHIVRSIEQIDSWKAFNQVQGRIQKKNDRIRLLHIFTRAAAVLFIPLLITSGWFLYQLNFETDIGQFATQRISNPPGVRSEVVLPDGSKVWLNAESTLCYQLPFGKKERDVQLTGEAFFEIKKDEEKPFRVESGKVRVTVLGTRFNYNAFPEEETVEVVLEEGKVKLSSTDIKDENEFFLKPGQRAVINKATHQASITSEDIEKYIGWHEGKLIFDESPLIEVGQRLERWFGIEVEIADPQIGSYRISTTFENESLHQILAMLELASPVKTRLIPSTFDKTAQTKSKERVIITSKN